ncbi:hypothetical protein BC629DRAFT_1093145 [Irpex lacteus]|nr:hypothetical protein BC629DRAFT_1093145 [Irpex lacteus]
MWCSMACGTVSCLSCRPSCAFKLMASELRRHQYLPSYPPIKAQGAAALRYSVDLHPCIASIFPRSLCPLRTSLFLYYSCVTIQMCRALIPKYECNRIGVEVCRTQKVVRRPMVVASYLFWPIVSLFFSTNKPEGRGVSFQKQQKVGRAY